MLGLICRHCLGAFPVLENDQDDLLLSEDRRSGVLLAPVVCPHCQRHHVQGAQLEAYTAVFEDLSTGDIYRVPGSSHTFVCLPACIDVADTEQTGTEFTPVRFNAVDIDTGQRFFHGAALPVQPAGSRRADPLGGWQDPDHTLPPFDLDVELTYRTFGGEQLEGEAALHAATPPYLRQSGRLYLGEWRRAGDGQRIAFPARWRLRTSIPLQPQHTPAALPSR